MLDGERLATLAWLAGRRLPGALARQGVAAAGVRRPPRRDHRHRVRPGLPRPARRLAGGVRARRRGAGRGRAGAPRARRRDAGRRARGLRDGRRARGRVQHRCPGRATGIARITADARRARAPWLDVCRTRPAPMPVLAEGVRRHAGRLARRGRRSTFRAADVPGARLPHLLGPRRADGPGRRAGQVPGHDSIAERGVPGRGRPGAGRRAPASSTGGPARAAARPAATRWCWPRSTLPPALGRGPLACCRPRDRAPGSAAAPAPVRAERCAGRLPAGHRVRPGRAARSPRRRCCGTAAAGSSSAPTWTGRSGRTGCCGCASPPTCPARLPVYQMRHRGHRAAVRLPDVDAARAPVDPGQPGAQLVRRSAPPRGSRSPARTAAPAQAIGVAEVIVPAGRTEPRGRP